MSPKHLKLAGKTLHKARIHGLIRKGLPAVEQSPFAYGSEIRNPDIGPFRACADVNQLRARTRDEALPSCLDISSVDRPIGVLHAQLCTRALGLLADREPCVCVVTCGRSPGISAPSGKASASTHDLRGTRDQGRHAFRLGIGHLAPRVMGTAHKEVAGPRVVESLEILAE